MIDEIMDNFVRDDSARERRMACRTELYRLHRDAKTPEQREGRLVKCHEYAHRNQFKRLILS